MDLSVTQESKILPNIDDKLPFGIFFKPLSLISRIPLELCNPIVTQFFDSLLNPSICSTQHPTGTYSVVRLGTSNTITVRLSNTVLTCRHCDTDNIL